MRKSSTGLDPKIGGLLCYLVGAITGLLMLVVEREDDDVRFHAYQSVATFGFLFLLSLTAGWVPVLGPFVQMLLGPVALVLWIVLMAKAFQGERFKLPWVGDWAESQLG